MCQAGRDRLKLDKAVQHLRTAQQQLKTYRQAVLNHWLNNDEAGISDASSPQNPQSATFDLQGRRIQGEPKHGVYIKEGKKVMK